MIRFNLLVNRAPAGSPYRRAAAVYMPELYGHARIRRWVACIQWSGGLA